MSYQGTPREDEEKSAKKSLSNYSLLPTAPLFTPDYFLRYQCLRNVFIYLAAEYV